jgi:hypothetical protein
MLKIRIRTALKKRNTAPLKRYFFAGTVCGTGRGVGLREKGLDAVQALKERGEQLDPVRSFSYASGTSGR